MSIIDGARVRWREWREAAEARKAAQVSDPPNVTVPAWLVRAAYFSSWVATCSLIYFLGLYTLDIARDRSGELHITRAGTWEGDVSFWFPYIVGFAIVAFGIPYVAKIAVPTFMSLHWKGNFWPKLWSLVIALAVSLVVIAGTFTVQGHTLMERDRDSAVAVEQVQNGRAAIQAQIDGINEDLRAASTNPNRTMAQAASVGMLAGSAEAAAAEWTRSYVQAAEAANAPNVELLRRATGAARAAGAAVERREQLRQQLAQAPAVASVQGEIVTERTGWIAETLGWLEGVRAILLSLVMDIVALLMPWIALRLEQARNRQMGMAEGIAKHPWMIEDLRGQEIVDSEGKKKEPEPMDPPRTIVTDAETGEQLMKIKPQPYWRKVKRGKKTQMEVPAENRGPDKDETGVAVDGGGRTAMAMTAAGPMDVASVAGALNGAENVLQQEHAAADANNDSKADEPDAQAGPEPIEQIQDTPPELSDDELAAIDAELATETEQNPKEDPAEADEQQPVEQGDTEPGQRTEPETDPAKLIAAE